MTETDDEFRARLIYVSGDGDVMLRNLHRMSGPQLDHHAEQFGLKRRVAPRALREFADAPSARWG